ncbi:DUF5302 domain-containing protein [Mycobacterium sp.]|uniref:DUF5302 domain-containing protein n=1 Tax=Mycobacterium sp. TaxID=1785 RepID=UPI003C757C84
MAESNSSQGSKSSKSSESSGSPESEDETKRKFRAALDRKIAKTSSGSDPKDSSGGKRSRVHGPVESRREFRRKSG